MGPYEEKLNRLLTDTYNNLIRVEENVLKDTGIDATINDVHIIEIIGRAGVITVGGIAAELGITAASVTVAVNRLASKGYLAKKKDENDRRSVHVTLARPGVRVYRLHRYFHIRMVQSVTKEMTEEQKTILCDGIEKLNKFFKESADERA